MFAYVGCYTTKDRDGRGDGIGVYRIDPATSVWTEIQRVTGLENPSWLTLDRRGRTVYVAHGGRHVVTAFRIDEASGQLSALGSQPSKGENGVRIDVDAANHFIVVANYSSATVASLPINADGSLGPVVDLVELKGKTGPVPTEQASAHPHDIVFDPRGKFLIVPDKGLDATFVFSIDPNGKLVAATPPSVASAPGAGPRHAAFHPTKPFAYVLNELDSTLTTFRYDGERGTLAPVETITTLPSGFSGTSKTSEIAVAKSGRFLYASNRGHDSIVIFAIDDAKGTLSAIGWEHTQGKRPRFFAIDPSGERLYAANQNSDTIVTFRVDQGSGKLTPTGHVVKTGSPSSIVFR
jgi:6-phosphogluconolactonase (cycloisomerase 2 family)